MKLWVVIFGGITLASCAQRVVDSDEIYSSGSSAAVQHVNGVQYDSYGFPISASGAAITTAENRLGSGEAFASQSPGVGVAIDGDTTIEAGQIVENPNEIVLSSYSQEQQKIDRERYAAQMAAIAAQRQEVTGVQVPIASQVNVAAYARSYTNPLGVRVYKRSGKRGRCSQYETSIAAQRAFLEAGGPSTDNLGLDHDGDGFACKFDPAPYRALQF